MNELNQRVTEALNTRCSELAAQMVAREFVRRPELEQRYGKAGREKCLQDAGYHLAYLAQAIACDSQALFVDYIGWAKVMLAKRGIPASDLAGLIENMKESLRSELPPDFSQLACSYLAAALQQLPQLPNDVSSFISESTSLAAQYLHALLRGDRRFASKLILASVQQGTSVRDIYLQVFERTQHEIGRLWQVNQISVAQEHYCTAATQQIMSQLYPYIFGADKTRGTLVAACITGDLHEIGARMLCDFFEIDGWRTHYLGADVPARDVIQTVVQYKADVLAISATITYHVGAVEALVAAVRRTPKCCGVRILVGGYPFKVDSALWKSIGADGSANGAQEAVALADRLTAQSLVGVNSVEAAPANQIRDSEVPIVTGEDLTAASSAAVKESATASEALQRREDRIYEDLSRANNELINAQREMARKNAELTAARQELEASEQRYSNLSACSPVGVLEMDAAGRCLYSNPHWRAITSLSADESVGDGWRRALAAGDAPAFIEAWNLARRNGVEFSREIRLVTTRGEERWAQLRSQAIRSDPGNVTGHVCTVEDITDRKRASALLMESRQRLAVATESARIGIWDWDMGAKKMVWDTQMCELYGIGGQEFGGTVDAWRTCLHPEDRDRVEADIAAALGGTKDYNTEFRVIWPNGEVRNIEAHGVVLRVGHSSPTRMIGVSWDITERLRTRVELAREHELNRIKSRFVSLVSHEFRTPLCVINAAASLLGDYSDKMTGQERSEHTREIQCAVERMTRMMEDFLLYETFESEKMECNTSPVNLEAICRELSSDALNDYRTHCPIECIIEPPAHEAFIDEKILRHILRNLLSNALKYSSDDQPVKLEVKRVAGNVQAEGAMKTPPGDHLQLLVRDAGIGIPAADLAKLYQPFHRGANAGNRPGAGMGLAIVRKFVDLHQGAIRVESTEGQGTSVRVWLPIASKEGAGRQLPQVESDTLRSRGGGQVGA
jgi:PAS domain S-box-containing protein